MADASQAAASVGAPAQAPGVQASPPSSGSVPEAKPPLPEVTVQARRVEIEPQVRSFLSGSLYLENNESPARWKTPVCPEVAGLSHGEAVFMLTRLSEIALHAGVPLAGEHCKPPNLFVIVTAKPEVALKWMRAHTWVFQNTSPSVVNAFIATPRAVRVWYNSNKVGLGMAHETRAMRIGQFENPVVFDDVDSSYLIRSVTWSFGLVVMVLDRTQLQGVTIGQLSDYVGMAAFSRLKSRMRLGDTPTILGLFKDASAGGTSVPAQAPPGMTAWDEAFLESLYHSNPGLLLQHEIMVKRMVNDLVPAVPTAAH